MKTEHMSIDEKLEKILEITIDTVLTRVTMHEPVMDYPTVSEIDNIVKLYNLLNRMRKCL